MSLPEKIKKFNEEKKFTINTPDREVLEVNLSYNTK